MAATYAAGEGQSALPASTGLQPPEVHLEIPVIKPPYKAAT